MAQNDRKNSIATTGSARVDRAEQVVTEKTQGHSRGASAQNPASDEMRAVMHAPGMAGRVSLAGWSILAGSMAGAFAGLAPDSALAAPQGGTVTAGSATISQNGSTTDIHQGTNGAVIEWQNFSIANGETVNFHQNADWAILNRVIGSDPSHIFGQLKADGTVVLINPNGILFGATAQVDVGSLVATTADVDNNAFQQWARGEVTTLEFDGSGAATGSVVNKGTISIADGGFAALVSPHVRNDAGGVISARLGKVVLGSGEAFTLDLYGDNLITFQLPTSAAGTASDGSAINGLVENSGRINAEGGHVVMAASAVEGIVENVINMDGIVRANRISQGEDGIVRIRGIGGDVSVSGEIDVSGTAAGVDGGEITITGDHTVRIADGAVLDARGATDGGKIAIGSQLETAETILESAASLLVDGGASGASLAESGNGGSIDLEAADHLRIAGSLSAQGGVQAGDGGAVSTISAGTVELDSTPDVSAPNGQGGHWYIEAASINIEDSGSSPVGTVSRIGGDRIGQALDDGATVTVSSRGDLELNGDIVRQEQAAGSSLVLDSAGSFVQQAGSVIRDAAGGLTVAIGSAVDVLIAGDIDAGDGEISVSAVNSISLEEAELSAVTISLRGDSDLDGIGDVSLRDSVLMAARYDAGLTGGSVEVTGARVGAFGNTLIDVSGDAGGGEILFGGDYLGTGDTRRSELTMVTADAVLKADAVTSGDGGKVIMWSDGDTWFNGRVSATGGALGGNGGFVESSGKNNLNVITGTVDTTALAGDAGQWLLDPLDIHVVAGGPATSVLTDVDQFGDVDLHGAQTNVLASALNMSAGNIVLQASNYIYFDTQVTLTNPVDLTATAGMSIYVNQSISGGVGSDLTFAATDHIIIAPTATVSTSGVGVVTLNADSNTGGVGDLRIDGNVYADTGAINGYGVNIFVNGTVNGGSTGTISLDTRSSTTIYVNGSVVSSAGNIDLAANEDIEANGSITSSTGIVTMIVDGDINIGGTISTDSAVTARANGSISLSGTISNVTSGSTGTVTLWADDDTSGGGSVTIDASGLVDRRFGTTDIRGKGVTINGDVTGIGTDIFVTATAGSAVVQGTGSVISTTSGDVTVSSATTIQSDGSLTTTTGALTTSSVSGSTFGSNSVLDSTSGAIELDADGGLTIDGTVGASTTSTIALDGDSSNDTAGDLAITGQVGNNGTVAVTANGASIDIISGSAIRGGSGVSLTSSGTIAIDGIVDTANGGSTGAITVDAGLGGTGDVVVGTTGNLMSNTGTIDISGFDIDHYGSVNTNGGSILISAANSYYAAPVAGLQSDTGAVVISAIAGDVTITNYVDSNGGSIDIDADNGTVTMSSAGSLYSNGGDVNITADLLSLDAASSIDSVGGDIDLESTNISGAATLGILDSGAGNIAAVSDGTLTVGGVVDTTSGDIQLEAADDLTVNAAIGATSTGNISLDSGTGLGGSGAVIVNAAVGGASAATVSLTGYDAVISSSITASGNVSLRQHIATNDMVLGSDSAGDFSLNSTEVSLLGSGADSVVLGDASGTGTLTVTGGGIQASSGDLLLQNDGAISIDNSVTGVAGNNVTVQSASGNIDVTVGGTVSASSGGNVSMDAGDSIIYDGLISTDSGDVTLTAAGSTISASGGGSISTTGGSVTLSLSGAGVVETGSIATGGAGTVQVQSAGTIDVLAGTTVSSTTGAVTLDANYSVTVAGTVDSASGGAIDIYTSASPSASPSITLVAGGAIGSAAAGNINIALQSGTATDFIDLNSNVQSAGNINLDSAGSININGLTMAGGTLTAAADYDLGVLPSVTATAGGTVTLAADELNTGVGTLQIATGAAVISTAADVKLRSETFDIQGSVSGATSITVSKNRAAADFTVGGGSGDIDDASIANLSAPDITFGATTQDSAYSLIINDLTLANTNLTLLTNTTGTYDLVGNVSVTGAGDITIGAGAALDISGASTSISTASGAITLAPTTTTLIGGGSLSMFAGGTSDITVSGSIDSDGSGGHTLALDADSGNVNVSGSLNVTATGAIALDGASINVTGSVESGQVDATADSGDAYFGGTVTSNGGDVTISATGGSAGLDGAIFSSGGAVCMTGATVDLGAAAIIVSGGGDVNLTGIASGTAVNLSAGSLVSSGNGQIVITASNANGDMLLGQIVSTNTSTTAGAEAVRISAGRSIDEADDATTEISTSGGVFLSAGGNVGANGTLLDVDAAEINVSATGTIVGLATTGDMNISGMAAGIATITAQADGDLNVNTSIATDGGITLIADANDDGVGDFATTGTIGSAISDFITLQGADLTISQNLVADGAITLSTSSNGVDLTLDDGITITANGTLSLTAADSIVMQNTTLTTSGSGAGDILLTATGGQILLEGGATQDLLSAQSVVLTGLMNTTGAGTATLQLTAAAGNIDINDDIAVAAGTDLTLDAAASGFINMSGASVDMGATGALVATSDNVTISGSLNTNQVDITATTDSAIAGPVTTNGGDFKLAAGGAVDMAGLVDTTGGLVDIAGGTVTFSTANSDLQTAGGAISVVSASGDLTMVTGSRFDAGSGEIALEATAADVILGELVTTSTATTVGAESVRIIAGGDIEAADMAALEVDTAGAVSFTSTGSTGNSSEAVDFVASELSLAASGTDANLASTANIVLTSASFGVSTSAVISSEQDISSTATLTSGANLTLAADSDNNGVGDITISSAIGGGVIQTIDLQAANVDVQAAINAADSINIATGSNGGNITLSAGGDLTAGSGDIDLAATDSVVINGGTATATSGDILLAGAGGGISISGGASQTLTAGNDILFNDVLSASGGGTATLTASAGNDVSFTSGITATGTDVDLVLSAGNQASVAGTVSMNSGNLSIAGQLHDLSATVTTTSGAVNVDVSNALTLTGSTLTVDGDLTIRTASAMTVTGGSSLTTINGGNMTLEADSDTTGSEGLALDAGVTLDAAGDLDVSGSSVSTDADLIAGGDLLLYSGDGAGTLASGTNGRLDTSGSAGDILINFGGTGTSTLGDIQGGSGSVQVTTGGDVSQQTGTLVDAGSGTISVSSGGSVSLEQLITTNTGTANGSEAVIISAAGAVTSVGDIDARGVAINAGGLIDVNGTGDQTVRLQATTSGATINYGGSGNVTFDVVSGDSDVSLGTDTGDLIVGTSVDSANGLIDLVANGTMVQVTAGSTVTAANSDVYILASDFDISGSVDAGNNVTVAQVDPETSLTVGAGGTVSDTEIGQLTAGNQIVLGREDMSNGSGVGVHNLQIVGAITTAENLTLVSGDGNIEHMAGGDITLTGAGSSLTYDIAGGGSVIVYGTNTGTTNGGDITVNAPLTLDSGGDLTFNSNGGNITLNGATGVSGAAAGSYLVLNGTTAGNVTIAGAMSLGTVDSLSVTANVISLPGAVSAYDLSLVAGSDLNIDNALTSTGGNIYLEGASVNVNATVTGSGDATILASDATTGAVNMNASGAVDISGGTGDLDITASGTAAGSSLTDLTTGTGQISVTTAQDLSLTGEIDGGMIDISAGGALTQSAGNVATTVAGATVNLSSGGAMSLAGGTSSFDSLVNVSSGGDLLVSGGTIGSGSGDIQIQAANITVNGATSIDTSGNITLTASGATDDILIADSGTSIGGSAAGNITLDASAGGSVTVSAATIETAQNLAVDAGQDTALISGATVLMSGGDARFTAGGSSATGIFSVDGSTVSGAGVTTVDAPVIQFANSGSLDGTDVQITANSTTTGSQISSVYSAGDLDITTAFDLAIDGIVRAGTGGSGALTIGVDGTLTQSSAVYNDGTGSSDIEAQAIVMTSAALVQAEGVCITANTTDLTMAYGSIVDGGAGAINLTAQNNLVTADLVTTNTSTTAGAEAIRLEATAGSINNINPLSVVDASGGAVALDAATGIGDVGILQIAGTEMAISQSVGGAAIQVDATTSITLTSFVAPSASGVSLAGSGDLTIDDSIEAASGAAIDIDAGGNAVFTATGSVIADGDVSVNSQLDITMADGSQIDAGSGDILLTATQTGGTITISSLQTSSTSTGAGGEAVQVLADSAIVVANTTVGVTDISAVNGEVALHAGSVGSIIPGTEITVDAAAVRSTASTGDLSVDATGDLTILQGEAAGDVLLTADNSLMIDGGITGQAIQLSADYNSDNSGTLYVNATVGDAANTTGNILLSGESVEIDAAVTGSASIDVYAADNLVMTSTAAITAGAGDVFLTADVASTGSHSIGNVTADGDITISLDGGTGRTLAGAVLQANTGDVTLTAASPVGMDGDLTLGSTSGDVVLDAGLDSDTGAAILTMTAGDMMQVTANGSAAGSTGDLDIGISGTNLVDIQGDLTSRNGDTSLSSSAGNILVTGASIGADVTGDVVLDAAAGNVIMDGTSELNVTGSGDISVDAGAATGTSTLASLLTQGGNIAVNITGDGSLEFAAGTVVDVTGAGDISLEAEGALDLANIMALGDNVVGGGITLAADSDGAGVSGDLNINTVFGSGAAWGSADLSGTNVTFGATGGIQIDGDVFVNGTVGNVDMAAGSVIDAGSGTITVEATTDVILGMLDTDSSSTTSGAEAVRVVAGNDILAAETGSTSIEVNATSGAIWLEGGNAVGSPTDFNQIEINAGSVGVLAGAGGVALHSTGDMITDSVTVTGGGDVFLRSEGALTVQSALATTGMTDLIAGSDGTGNVTVNAQIGSTTSDNINISGEAITVNADILSNQTINLTSTSSDIAVNSATLDATAGTADILVNAAGNVAMTGSYVRGNGLLDVDAGGNVTLDSTTLNGSTGTGDITVDAGTDVMLQNSAVLYGGGNIQVTAGGNLTADASGVDATAGTGTVVLDAALDSTIQNGAIIASCSTLDVVAGGDLLVDDALLDTAGGSGDLTLDAVGDLAVQNNAALNSGGDILVQADNDLSVESGAALATNNEIHLNADAEGNNVGDLLIGAGAVVGDSNTSLVNITGTDVAVAGTVDANTDVTLTAQEQLTFGSAAIVAGSATGTITVESDQSGGGTFDMRVEGNIGNSGASQIVFDSGSSTLIVNGTVQSGGDINMTVAGGGSFVMEGQGDLQAADGIEVDAAAATGTSHVIGNMTASGPNGISIDLGGDGQFLAGAILDSTGGAGDILLQSGGALGLPGSATLKAGTGDVILAADVSGMSASGSLTLTSASGDVDIQNDINVTSAGDMAAVTATGTNISASGDISTGGAAISLTATDQIVLDGDIDSAGGDVVAVADGDLFANGMLVAGTGGINLTADANNDSTGSLTTTGPIGDASSAFVALQGAGLSLAGDVISGGDANVTSTNGTLALTGVIISAGNGGTGDANVVAKIGAVSLDGSSHVYANGTGTASLDANDGDIIMAAGSSVEATAAGSAISLAVTNGTVTMSEGSALDVSAGTGEITVNVDDNGVGLDLTVADMTTAGGSILVQGTNATNILVADNSTIDVAGSGDISLIADGGLNPGNNVSLGASMTGILTLIADNEGGGGDDLTIDTALGGAVSWSGLVVKGSNVSMTGSGSITLDANVTVEATAGSIFMADNAATFIDSGASGNINLTANGGDVHVNSLLSSGTGSVVTIQADGSVLAVNDSRTEIDTAGSVNITAGLGGAGDIEGADSANHSFDVNASLIDGTTTNGEIDFGAHAGYDLNVGNVSTSGGGNITLSADDNVLIQGTVGTDGTAGANITVTADGDGTGGGDVTIQGDLGGGTSTGTVDVSGENILFSTPAATLSVAGSAAITLVANDSLTMASGSSIDGGGGDISVQAVNGNLSLADITTSSASNVSGAEALILDAAVGSILNAGGTLSVQNGRIDLNAGTDIGNGTVALATDADELTATGTGTVNISDSGDVTLLSVAGTPASVLVDAAGILDVNSSVTGGNITLSAGSDLNINSGSDVTATTDTSLTSSTGNITLSGGIVDAGTNVTLSAGQDVTLGIGTTIAASATGDLVVTADSDLNGSGDLIFNDAVTAAGLNSMSLSGASVSFTAAADITMSGDLSVSATDAAGSVDMADGTVFDTGTGQALLDSAGSIVLGEVSNTNTSTTAGSEAIRVTAVGPITVADTTGTVTELTTPGAVYISGDQIGAVGATSYIDVSAAQIESLGGAGSTALRAQSGDLNVIGADATAGGSIDLLADAGNVNISGAVGSAAAGDVNITATNGSVVLNAGGDVTGSGDVTIDAATSTDILGAPTTITSTGGDITLWGPVNVASGASLQGDAAQDLYIDDSMLLDGSAILTSGNDMTFNGTVSGAQSLTATAGGVLQNPNGGTINLTGGVSLTGNSVILSNSVTTANQVDLISTGGVLQIDAPVTAGTLVNIMADSMTVSSGTDSVVGPNINIGTYSVSDLTIGDPGSGLIIGTTSLDALDATTGAVTFGTGNTQVTRVGANGAINERVILTGGSGVEFAGSLVVSGYGNSVDVLTPAWVASNSYVQTNNGDLDFHNSVDTRGHSLSLNTNAGITGVAGGGDVHFTYAYGEGQIYITGGDVLVEDMSLDLIDVYHTSSANLTGVVDGLTHWMTVSAPDVIMPENSPVHFINNCTKNGCSSTTDIFTDMETAVDLGGTSVDDPVYTPGGDEPWDGVVGDLPDLDDPVFGGDSGGGTSGSSSDSPSGDAGTTEGSLFDDLFGSGTTGGETGADPNSPIFGSGDPLLGSGEDGDLFAGPLYGEEETASLDELIKGGELVGDDEMVGLMQDIADLMNDAEASGLAIAQVPSGPYNQQTTIVPGLVTYVPGSFSIGCDPARVDGCGGITGEDRELPGFAAFQF